MSNQVGIEGVATKLRSSSIRKLEMKSNRIYKYIKMESLKQEQEIKRGIEYYNTTPKYKNIKNL